MRPRDSAYRTRWWRDLPLIALTGVFAIALVTVIVLSSIRPLHPSVQYVFQAITLVAALLGSYRFGRNTAKEAAYDVIRPHARAALRRILTLRDSLFRLSIRIEDYKIDQYDVRLDVIQAIIDEQIPTGGSAVEDWRDIVPEDVDEILRAWPTQGRVEQDDNSK